MVTFLQINISKTERKLTLFAPDLWESGRYLQALSNLWVLPAFGHYLSPSHKQVKLAVRRLPCYRRNERKMTTDEVITSKESMEHSHILKWSNLERIIYCKDENCDYVIDATEILKIVKSYEDFINTNTLPLTNTE